MLPILIHKPKYRKKIVLSDVIDPFVHFIRNKSKRNTANTAKTFMLWTTLVVLVKHLVCCVCVPVCLSNNFRKKCTSDTDHWQADSAWLWSRYRWHVWLCIKVGFLYSAAYAMTGPAHFTISVMAVDWKEPMVLQRKLRPSNCVNVQLDPRYAASKHTTAPINHTRPSPCKHSPDVATRARKQTSDYYSSYRPRKDETLSWLVGWHVEDGIPT